MRSVAALVLLLLAALPLWAKPKVEVRIKIDDQIIKERPQDSLSRGGGAAIPTTIYGTIYFLNVTVLSDNAEAVAKNNGQWCISGDIELDKATEYHGTLNGNSIELEIPQKDGKTKRKNFEVFDHKWRKLIDLSRLFDLRPPFVELYG
jgi:hypothetical protein